MYSAKLFNLIVFERNIATRIERRRRKNADSTSDTREGRASGNQMFADKSSSFSTIQENQQTPLVRT